MPIVIDDSSVIPADGAKGFKGIFPNMALAAQANTFADTGIPLIDEDILDDVLRQQEKDGTTIEDICNDMGLPPLNQQSTNYCWGNCVVHCAEILYLLQTGEVISLSPASVCAPIKNFWNQGGWVSEALEFMKVNGVNLSEDWPDNSRDRRLHNADNKAKALDHLVLEYAYLRNWQERASCIAAGYPTADGYNWWRHAVCGTGVKPGNQDLQIRNSWGGWGDNGFGWLSGRRKHADGSIVIYSMKPL